MKGETPEKMQTNVKMSSTEIAHSLLKVGEVYTNNQCI